MAPCFAAGDEMGRFYLGSTVVLLFEPGRVEWLPELGPAALCAWARRSAGGSSRTRGRR